MILETNALSAVADGDPAAVRIFSQASSIELPVIVLGEYRYGIAQFLQTIYASRHSAANIASRHEPGQPL